MEALLSDTPTCIATDHLSVVPYPHVSNVLICREQHPPPPPPPSSVIHVLTVVLFSSPFQPQCFEESFKEKVLSFAAAWNQRPQSEWHVLEMWLRYLLDHAEAVQFPTITVSGTSNRGRRIHQKTTTTTTTTKNPTHPEYLLSYCAIM